MTQWKCPLPCFIPFKPSTEEAEAGPSFFPLVSFCEFAFDWISKTPWTELEYRLIPIGFRDLKYVYQYILKHIWTQWAYFSDPPLYGLIEYYLPFLLTHATPNFGESTNRKMSSVTCQYLKCMDGLETVEKQLNGISKFSCILAIMSVS